MSQTFCTIIIPISPDHEAIAGEAIDSAHKQTISCPVITVPDPDRTGAGAARNRGAIQALDSLFYVFLDADDVLYPDYVERCAQAYVPDNYVYTDFLVHTLNQGVISHQTPDCQRFSIWQGGQAHLNTVFMPAAMHHAVGGYDEQLPAMEDTDYFLKLQSRGWCGVRAPEPLVVYRVNRGKRSDYIRGKPANQDALEYELKRRYERYANVSCGCGQTVPPQMTPKNEAFDNAILAKAMYPPMKKVGTVTRRLYERAGHGEILYVDAQDAAAKPDWWQPVINEVRTTFTPAVDEVQALALAALKRETA